MSGLVCDRCGDSLPSVREALGCVLCVDCVGWLRSLTPAAVEAERATWAVPGALSDLALAKIAAAQSSEAFERRRMRQKAAKRRAMDQGPQYQKR